MDHVIKIEPVVTNFNLRPRFRFTTMLIISETTYPTAIIIPMYIKLFMNGTKNTIMPPDKTPITNPTTIARIKTERGTSKVGNFFLGEHSIQRTPTGERATQMWQIGSSHFPHLSLVLEFLCLTQYIGDVIKFSDFLIYNLGRRFVHSILP